MAVTQVSGITKKNNYKKTVKYQFKIFINLVFLQCWFIKLVHSEKEKGHRILGKLRTQLPFHSIGEGTGLEYCYLIKVKRKG